MPVPLIVAGGTTACCLAALQDCGADEENVDSTQPTTSLPESGNVANSAALPSVPSSGHADLKWDEHGFPSSHFPVAAGNSAHLGSGRTSSKISSSLIRVTGGTSAFHHPQQQIDDHGGGNISQREQKKSKRERIRAKLDRITSFSEDEGDEKQYDHGNEEADKTTNVPAPGYVNGLFTEGKVRDIVPPSGCFVIKFSPDSSLMAVGLKSGEGVAIYETKYFSVVLIIERDDTVSAIDWCSLPSPQYVRRGDNVGSPFLLGIGGFDGVVSLYSVHYELMELEGEGATLLQSYRLDSEIRALKFMNGPGLEKLPLHLAVGEKNGRLSFLCGGNTSTDGELRCVEHEESAVLAIEFCTFGRKVMATGMKDGQIRVNIIRVNNGRAELGHRLCEIQRNGAVHSLAFSHDSARLFVGGYDKSLAVIDTKVWDIIREMSVEGTIQSIEYDPLARYIAVGSRVRTLTLYDTSTLQPVKEFQFAGWAASLSWGTNALEDFIAVRCGHQLISFINLRPIHIIPKNLKTSRGEGSSLSWSYNGQFIARANGNEVAVADATWSFVDIATAKRKDVVRCVRFCMSEGKRNLLAVVGLDGHLAIYKLFRGIEGAYCLEIILSSFVEKILWSVAWSSDGSFLACGGREKTLRLISALDLQERSPPIKLKGRVWDIQFMPNGCSEIGLAVGTGDYLATIYDITGNEPTPVLQITRPRTVRCLCYHPDLPILALGDGANNVVIIDLLEEKTFFEFSVGGRVHSLDFSCCGSFLAVASDDCRFTIHETGSFKVVQEIPTNGLATCVAFSGVNGAHLALDSDIDDAKIVHLGPFLSTEFIPLKDGLDSLPGWAVNEAVYRSGQGPSLIQRLMRDGSGDSLKQAAAIMEKYPEASYTIDRTNGEGCYDAALGLRRPNLLKLLLLKVVDGTLETEDDTKGTLLTSEISQRGVDILLDMLLYHPPKYVCEILKNTTFIKVPFTMPRVCATSDIQECASTSFADPWSGAHSDHRKSLKRSETTIDPIEESGVEIFRTPAVLPLKGLGSLKFLTALTTSAPPDAFDNDAMGIVLRVMWYYHVRRYFLLDVTIFTIFYVLWVLFINWTSSTTYLNSPLFRQDWAAILFAVLVLLFNTLFGMKEIAESDWGRNKKYFKFFWNYVDFASITLVYAYTISTSLYGVGSGSVPLAVFTTLLLTLKLIAYLRGFAETGWLISVLVSNFVDIRGFVVVLVAIVVGFTAVFRLLFGDVKGVCTLALGAYDEIVEDCDKQPFGTLSKSFLSTFELAVVGEYDSAIFAESQYSVLASLTFVAAVTVVLVVALNALIAVLGDSYSRVQEHERANRRRERAELIVEYLTLMPVRKRREIENSTKYFHALLEADADGDLVVNKNDWQGGLNALKSDLNEMNEAHAEVTLKAINSLKVEFDNEINQLRRDISSILQDVHSEVKALARMQRDGGVTFKNTNVARAVKSVQSIGKNIPKWGPGQFAGRNVFRPVQRRSNFEEAGYDERDDFKLESPRPDSPRRFVEA